MAITLNKKICLEFFEIFFGGFQSTVSKLMGCTVYLLILEDDDLILVILDKPVSDTTKSSPQFSCHTGIERLSVSYSDAMPDITPPNIIQIPFFKCLLFSSSYKAVLHLKKNIF